MTQNTQPKNRDNRFVKYIAVIVVLVVLASGAFVYFNSLNGSPKANKTITVTDDLGRSVNITLPITRVVSMDPSNTQMMYAIGAGNLLVADTSYDWWPSNSTSLPKVEMDNGTASVEEVVSFKPNLVLATTIQPMSIVDQLENLSIPVLVLEPQNISGIYRDMYILGNVTGHENGAINEITKMKNYISSISQKVDEYNKISVLYMLWPDPIYTVGPGSFINDIISTANGFNIASNLSSPYPIIGNETIVADNPQAIIVDNGTGISNISYFTSNPMWQNISAVKNDKILFLNRTESSEMNEPGPLTMYAVQIVAEFLYPQAFS